jgi:NAD(P)-dependent dehydrogenase (short-subunit alcohol dehydrogenase family)
MNSHSVDFSGETVLVIAATGDIGSVTAERFAAAGAHVMATARQLEGPLAEVVERIRAAGGSEPRHWPWT